MDKGQINDNIFEALFRQAVIDNFYEELDSLPPDEELAKMYIASPEHALRMKKLFAREARKDRHRAALKTGKRVVAAIVIAICILFCALMLVPRVRATVVSTVVEWFEAFTRFTSGTPVMDSESLEPTHIPEGFWEAGRYFDDVMTIILYKNGDGEIIVLQSSLADGVLTIDNEYAIYELRIINGIEYHVLTAIESGDENSIIWDIGGWRYVLRSIIYVEYIQNMALSFG